MTVIKNNRGSYNFEIEPFKKEKEHKKMTLDIGNDIQFEYNIDQDYQTNFDRWVRWVNRERRFYKEEEIDIKKAEEEFKVLYGSI